MPRDTSYGIPVWTCPVCDQPTCICAKFGGPTRVQGNEDWEIVQWIEQMLNAELDASIADAAIRNTLLPQDIDRELVQLELVTKCESLLTAHERVMDRFR